MSAPKDVILISTVTCPKCSNRERVVMPRYASKTFYQCPACKYVFQTNKKECCIFCLIGEQPCPPRQQNEKETDSNFTS